MPAVDLIPQIIAIAKEHDTQTATGMIKRLFKEYDIHVSKVQQWTPAELANIKTGADHPDYKVEEYNPHAIADKTVSEQLVDVSKPANADEIIDALKNLGSPKLNP